MCTHFMYVCVKFVNLRPKIRTYHYLLTAFWRCTTVFVYLLLLSQRAKTTIPSSRLFVVVLGITHKIHAQIFLNGFIRLACVFVCRFYFSLSITVDIVVVVVVVVIAVCPSLSIHVHQKTESQFVRKREFSYFERLYAFSIRIDRPFFTFCSQFNCQMEHFEMYIWSASENSNWEVEWVKTETESEKHKEIEWERVFVFVCMEWEKFRKLNEVCVAVGTQ